MVERLGNWGRWGDDDERGTLNLAGPDAVSLGIPLRARATPVVPPRPSIVHLMALDGADYEAGSPRADNGFQFADDYLALSCHTGTHVDALSHVGRDGAMYNGHPTTSVRSTTGARKLGIERFGSLATRGVLLDIPAALGVETLGDHVEIGVADIELALGGLELEPGDAVLIRTGWLERYDGADPSWYEREPGIGVEAARWLAARDVSLIAADNFAVELVPPKDGEMMPVHLICLQEHGIHLIEFVDLTTLAQSGVRTCLLVVAPLAVVGGVGSPVNPIAVY